MTIKEDESQGLMLQPQKMTAKRHLLGRNLVLQLHMVLKTMRIHDPTNQALLIATENLKDTINTLWASLDGSVQLQFVEGIAYLNDMRLRLEANVREQVNFIQGEFEIRGLGGLAFSRPVDAAALHVFLVALSKPVHNEEDVQVFRESLMEFKELALDLLGPKQFNDGDEAENELRIDKKTFALQTYAKAIIAVREFVEALKEGRDPIRSGLHIVRIIQDMVDIATERVNFLLRLSAIKKAHDYVNNHAVNTAILSIIIGRALGIDRIALVDLGTSGLLANVSLALMPPDLVEKRGRLTEEEKTEVHNAMVRHIRSIMGDGKLNDAMIRRVIVAYEHHRPYKVQGQDQRIQLHVFSRIVAVADAFDALTTRRPWREGYTADEALRILVTESGTKFDPVIVRVLVNLMGMYPLGSAVRLDSGELGVVYHNSNSPEFYDRPWVKIVSDAAGVRIKRTLIRNLAEGTDAEHRIAGLAKADELEGVDPGMLVVV